MDLRCGPIPVRFGWTRQIVIPPLSSSYRQRRQIDSRKQANLRQAPRAEFLRPPNPLYSNVFHLTTTNFVEYGVPLPNL
jgi:hypothetical protein